MLPAPPLLPCLASSSSKLKHAAYLAPCTSRVAVVPAPLQNLAGSCDSAQRALLPHPTPAALCGTTLQSIM